MKIKFTISIVVILILGGVIYVVNQKYHLNQRVQWRSLFAQHVENKQPKLSELIPLGTAVSLKIDKSDYRLYVYAQDTLVKTYAVVFGGNPTDDKRMQGDQCTPEGIFYIQDKYPHKSWHKFIWLNYPTPDSWQKHRQAKQEGKIPATAKIGGEIGIHGVPDGKDFAIDKRINWTLGCISLKNSEIDEIYPYITKKTPIQIQK